MRVGRVEAETPKAASGDAWMTTLAEQRSLGAVDGQALESVFGGSDEALFVQLGGKLVYLNEAAEVLLDRGAHADLIGTSVLELWVPEDRAIVAERVRDLLERAIPATPRRLRLQRGDGRARAVEVSGLPFERHGVHGAIVRLRDLEAAARRVDLEETHEAQFRAVIDSLAAHVAVVDAQGTIVMVNAAWSRFEHDNDGVPAASSVGANYLAVARGCTGDAADVDAARRASDAIAQVLEGERPHFVMEYPCHAPNEERWFSMSVTPLGGPRRGAVISHTNVTATVVAERRSRASVATLEAALASMTDGVYIADAHGKVLRINQAFARFYRFADLERCKQTLEEFPALLNAYRMDGTRAPLEEWATPRALRGETAVGATYQLERRDTGERWVGNYGFAPVRDAGGAIVGAVVVVRDVTDERAAKEALRQSEERFSQIFRASPVALALSRRADGLLLDSNEAFGALFGFSREEVLGRTTRELGIFTAEADRPALMERLERDGQLMGRELPVRMRGGELRTVSLSIQPVALHGEACLVTAIVDTTERHRDEAARASLQLQLQHAQRLESVGRLAGGVAHDFNNLLSVIVNCAELIEDSLEVDNPVRDEVEHILTASARATTLTRQLLAFGSRQALKPEVLDLRALIRGMERMLVRVVGEDVTLVVREADDVPLVRADPGQLEQVLMNLAVNARDAMPDGGRLEIETSRVARADASGPHDWLRWTVRDSGAGIAPDVAARIFEPFFTTKEPGKGTGLGLATVYGIVQQSGGNIHMESLPGAGATFIIELPATDAPLAAAPESARPKRRSLRDSKILVVEDDPDVRALITRILEGAGYRVSIAQDAEAALTLCRDVGTEISLLLTDVVMPGKNGKVLADEAKALRPGLRVLFMSGYSDEILGVRGILASSVRLLDKPFTGATLLSAVASALDCD
jgi:PAS domain S-box-containing protein